MATATETPRPTRRPTPGALAGRAQERLDQIRAFDPGQNQALIAVGVMTGVAVTIGLIYLFEQLFHGMWIEPPAGAALPASQLALLHAQHHGETVLAMLLGGMIGMLSAFAVSDTRPRTLALTMTLGPAPMLASLAVAVELDHRRTLGIIVMALVMGLGVWLPKWTPKIGPRAFLFGQMLFVGYLVGFLSNGEISSGQLGWIAAVLWVAAAISFVLKLAIFIPLGRGALDRSVTAFFARSRGAIRAAAELLDAAPGGPRERARRRLRRRLTQLNEAALIVDGRLPDRAETAYATHERLFTTELAVQNIGRLVDALCQEATPQRLLEDVRAGVIAVRNRAADSDEALEDLSRWGAAGERIGPLQAGRAVRLVAALSDWQAALGRLERGEVPRSDVDTTPFDTQVMLVFGNLPGSAPTANAAAAPPGSWRARLHLDAPAQSAIRIAVAVGVASALGSILSERRFYWAVLAVFVAYMGTFTSGEQVFKAFQRVAGTVIGILVGSLLAHAVGDSTWSVLVIVLALGFGIYFMRLSYALMVIGVTIMVSQLYVQLGEFSNSLLTLRLEETAIGAAVAMTAALVIFPVRTRTATRVATRNFYHQLGTLLEGLGGSLADPDGAIQAPTSAARSLDHVGQQLLFTARPLARSPFRRRGIAENLQLFELVSHHARNLVADVQRGLPLQPLVRDAAAGTVRTQRRLVAALEDQVDTLTAGGEPAEIAARLDGELIDRVRLDGDLLPVVAQEGIEPEELRFLRHVARLDEALAQLADNLAGR